MWYTIQNKQGHKVIVREISERLALRKAASILKRESKIKGIKIYKHKPTYWTDLEIIECKK